MKKYIICLLYLVLAQSVFSGVIVSHSGSLPTILGPFQTDTSKVDAIQTRNTQAGGADWRGISESFRWNITNDLDAIGFHVASPTVLSYDVDYLLVVQQLTGDKTAPTATLAQIEFTISPADVVAGEWLHLDLANNLEMEYDQWYGVTLCPVSNAVNGARMYWSASASNVYEGAGQQIAPLSTGMPRTSAYASQGFDLAFYMQGVSASMDLVVSNPTNAPTQNVVISQLGTGNGNHQSRHTGETDWRGIAQSFQWTSTEVLGGIGLYIDSVTAYSSDQQHVLIIQELDGFKGFPVITVYQDEFTLAATNVAAQQWVHFDIGSLTMKENHYYGIVVTPAETAISPQRIGWSLGGTYSSGAANQFDLVSRGLPPGSTSSYGGTVAINTTFYLQSVLEPAPEVPAIGDITINSDGENVFIGWQGGASGTYTVQKKIGLLVGGWSNVVEGLPGVDGTMSATNAITSPNAFYQVLGQ